MRVTMVIDRNVAVKTDAVATIRPNSAGGRGFVELTVGSSNAPIACEGACLLTVEEGSFDSNYPSYQLAPQSAIPPAR